GLAFQPIVDARTNAVVMHEALLRLSSQDGETVAAHHLVPIAEKLGLIRLLDRRMMMLAVQQLLQHPEARLSLNVSGITATDPRWFGQLTEILAEHGEAVKRLTVEIAETATLRDPGQTSRFIGGLRELGCGIAIDGFGTGHTSFRNLKLLNVDMIKLDASFSELLSANRDNQYFLRSLVDLARRFDVRTIAERVQTEEDAELLRSWGVDYLQGKMYGDAVHDLPWPQGEKTVTTFVAATGHEAEAGAVTSTTSPGDPDVQPRPEPMWTEEAAEPEAQAVPQDEAEPEVADQPEEEGLDFSRLRQALAALEAGRR
ncbi:MAG TPA: EAL domain-containing protein, partial [Aestuariivirgaceae bacterium]|nr:EAL domain-containing protein [Aestuariivirgaceae bacterium]